MLGEGTFESKVRQGIPHIIHSQKKNVVNSVRLDHYLSFVTFIIKNHSQKFPLTIICSGYLRPVKVILDIMILSEA